eukprot:710404-Pyramimonas_sp.AAC.1
MNRGERQQQQQQQRPPPYTSSQWVTTSRSRAGCPHNYYRNRVLAWDFLMVDSSAAPATLRNHVLALSLELSSRAMQYSRFSNTPSRPGRLGPPSRPAR